jgi:hypothetical protein
MAVSFVGAGTRVTSSIATPLSVPLPSGISVGDYMILKVDASFSGTVTDFTIASAGTWDLFTSQYFADPYITGSYGSVLYTKVVEAGEAAPTVDKPTNNISRVCRIYAVTGGTVVSDGVDKSTTGNVTTFSPSIAQPSSDGLALVYTRARNVIRSTSGSPPSVPNGWTAVDENPGSATLLSSDGGVIWYRTATAGDTYTAPSCTTPIPAPWAGFSWVIGGSDVGWSIDTISY